jgi:2-C-methyl-D-erythritol 4-phosphate cytidylyltransferase
VKTFAVILPAAGSSTRFGGQRNKLLETLQEKAVIVRSVEAFSQRDDVAQIVIPTTFADELRPMLCSGKTKLCAGGANRAESVRAALLNVSKSIEWVAVHDAARPLVSQDLIERTCRAAQQYGAAVPALPVNLTIKQADGPLPARVQRTVPRHTLWAMQTPQIMRRETLLRAYEKCPLPLDQITDDAQLLELIGEEVWLVPGEERNLKITTPADLRLAELYLSEP